MKKAIILLICIMLVFDLASQSVERDIEDYFDLLKEEWICDLIKRNEKVVDVRNGYIAYRDDDDDFEPYFQMALFKDAEGKDLMVIHKPGFACADIFECAHVDERETYFVRYENEKWVDVRKVVMPKIQTADFYADSTLTDLVEAHAPHAIAYDLAQLGQTITLILEICDGYINFDDPDEPVVSDEEIQRILEERRVRKLHWNKEFGVFELGE